MGHFFPTGSSSRRPGPSAIGVLARRRGRRSAGAVLDGLHELARLSAQRFQGRPELPRALHRDRRELDRRRQPAHQQRRAERRRCTVCRRHAVACWNNIETFSRGFPYKFPPLDWPILKEKMALADPYVEKHITFEFSHFLSPNSTSPAARNLFQRYREEIIGADA